MHELISIIVPVYNVAPLLEKCISSLVNQTYRNLEILLINDGSTDESGRICDAWKVKDERIVVCHQENSGIAKTRNSGIQKAGGQYLMFVDSDDFLSSDAVQVLYDRILMEGSDMAVGNGVCVNEQGEVVGDLYATVQDRCCTSNEIYDDFYHLPCMVWGKLYKRDILKTLSFPDLKSGEDLYMLIDVVANCNKVSLCSDIIYYYTQRSTSVVHTLNDKKLFDSFSAALYACKRLLEGNYRASARKFFSIALFRASEMYDPLSARKSIADLLAFCDQIRLIKFDVHNLIRWGAVNVPAIHYVLKNHRKNTSQKEK